MQLRRFTADSTPAALGAVREELGDDAIILANRKIGDQVEIIATGQLDDAQALADISLDSSIQSQSRKTELHDTVPLPDVPSEQRSRNGHAKSFEDLTAAIDADDSQASSARSAISVEHSQNTDAIEKPAQLSAEPNTVVVDKSRERSLAGRNIHPRGSDLIANGNRQAEPQADKSAHNASVAEALQNEIHVLTSSIDSVLTKQTEKLYQVIEAQSQMINQNFKGMEVNLWGNNSPNRRLHLQHLFSMGIGAELAIQLAERADPSASVDDALRQSFALLKSTLPIGKDKTFTVPGITIFTGPTGAGKTTALMKVATQHVKEHGSDSIVIICADTRKIGAFEELQAYGKLLGVPTVHAHDSAELDSLLAAFTHKKLVLIDHTLLRSDDAVELPERLLKPVVTDSVRQLMVLSATSQSAALDALIRRHCEGRNMQCVLTHLDDNAKLGEVFNAIIRHHLPIAYWSDAASVQKPLQKAEASVLVATAAAMSRRLIQTPDDDWLLRLIQPSDELISTPLYTRKSQEVNA